MPVRNGERHLRDAIDSILRQTHREFEFLIVDDGSTDRSQEIVSSYRESRIRFVTMARQAGLSAALNEGLRLAKAAIIARQDADDVSESDRLSRQLAKMEAHPEIALLGSQAVAVTEAGRQTGTVYRPTELRSMRWFSAF